MISTETTNVRVLGSTSSGNSTLVWKDKSAVMIDCGFSKKYIFENFKKLDISISILKGILISHTHSDHSSSSMIRAALKHGIKIYCHKNLREILIRKYPILSEGENSGIINVFQDDEFQIGEFFISAFSVPHDSEGGCWGFNICSHKDKGKKISIATDLGYPENGLWKNFIDSEVIIIESNHDPEMLRNSGRPIWLQQRIEEIGHLSNEQSSEFILDVIKRSQFEPQAIILSHISQQCNSGHLAYSTLNTKLKNNNYTRSKIYISHKFKPGEIISF